MTTSNNLFPSNVIHASFWAITRIPKCGEAIAKTEYLVASHLLKTCLHPLQTYHTLHQLWNTTETSHPVQSIPILGNRFTITSKEKLSARERAFDEFLGTVQWNLWCTHYETTLQKTVYLSTWSLAKHHLECLNGIHPSTLEFAEKVIAQLDTSNISNDEYAKWLTKIIQKIKMLKQPNEIIRCFLAQKKIHLLIAGDHKIYRVGDFQGQGAVKSAFAGKLLIENQKLAILEVPLKSESTEINIKREISNLQTLKEIPGVISLHGVYEEIHTDPKECKKVFLMEEWCKGALLDRLPLLKKNERIQVAFQFLRIMKDFHQNGYRHGDIKVDNIFIQGKDQKLKVKLGDLSEAHRLDCKPLTKGGSLFFMAPESLGNLLECAPTIFGINEEIQAEIFEVGLVLLELFDFQNTMEFSPTPWADQTQLFLHNRLTLSQLKDAIVEKSSRIMSNVAENHDNHENFYHALMQMIDPHDPSSRLSIDEMIQILNQLEWDSMPEPQIRKKQENTLPLPNSFRPKEFNSFIFSY